MDLLVAYGEDPAGRNMAEYFAGSMKKEDGGLYRGDSYDLAIIDSPAISADWLESRFAYDGYVFLSRHAAESGTLALTCHSTGNFGEALFGGKRREVAIPYPSVQKTYMKKLWERREEFGDFEITLETTHHGPTSLGRPSVFVEVGTTEAQWGDAKLCHSVAAILEEALAERGQYPEAIGFGGSHYPGPFTREVVEGGYALGTIVPRRAMEEVDGEMLSHIMSRNGGAQAALLEWDGMGKHRREVVRLLDETDLEVVRL